MAFIQRVRSFSIRGSVDGDLRLGPLKVTVVGSGNWGSTASKIIGSNAAKHDLFQTQVTMWVHEEMVDNQKLSEIINTQHENVKYLPGIKLPSNVIAEPDLATACADAHILVFVLPHQFLPGLLPIIKKVMNPGAFAISLIKGIDFNANKVVLLSEIIRNELDIDVSVLMGANVANEIAREEFAEATIGGTEDHAKTLQTLFQTPYFRINTVGHANAVELCGALKNVVALGAGFCDGMGMGNNTKAAIIRIGLIEIARIIEHVTNHFPLEIMLESCGCADLITTCYGGRNRKCAEEFVRCPGKKWDAIEAELLNGQRLQGTTTCLELKKIFSSSGIDLTKTFPLFNNIYEIAFEGKDPSSLVEGLVAEEKLVKGHLTEPENR